MKKYISFTAGLMLLGFAAGAQNPVHMMPSNPHHADERYAAPGQGSEQKTFAAFKFFEPDNLHDFGTIPEGPKVTYTFTFINEGNEPLVISNAQASCGCTSPTFPKEPILPGQKGKIAVTYTTEGHPGNFEKSIYLTSNALLTDGRPHYELLIKGIVIPAKKK